MPENYPWVLTDLSSGPHFAAEFPPMLNTHSWTGISQHITHALQMCEGPIKANQKMKWEQKVIMCNHPQWHLLLQTPNNQQWWYNALLKQKESPVCVVSPESLMYWHANGDATPSHISSLNYLHVFIKWIFLVCKTYIFLSQHPVGNLKIFRIIGIYTKNWSKIEWGTLKHHCCCPLICFWRVLKLRLTQWVDIPQLPSWKNNMNSIWKGTGRICVNAQQISSSSLI